MVELVNNDIVIKIRRGFRGEILRVEGLNRHEQIINAVRLVAADKHFAEVSILQHRTKGIKALLEDFLTVCNKQQTTGTIGILLAEMLVIQRGNDRLAGTRRGNNEVVIISAHIALGIELVQNLLLIGVGLNIHRVDLGIVGVEILFCFQCASKTFFLILAVILKLIGIPVAFKGCGDLINGFRQVLFCDFNVPFQTA